jgi:hypothetical protein
VIIFRLDHHCPGGQGVVCRIGFAANRRLLGVQRLSRNPADGAAALTAITGPVTTSTGQRVAGIP